MSDIIFYFALVLFVIGAIGYGWYMSRVLKNNLRITKNELLKKKTLVLGGFWGIIALSLILFTVSFYQDPTTIGYLASKNIEIGRASCRERVFRAV